MSLILSALDVVLQDGFMYAILAMGYYISYTILDFPDLTVEGTVVTGGVVFGLLCDLIMKSGQYQSWKKTLLGYGVFSLWMVGTYIPMYFMVEQSRADFAAGFGEEYADKVMSVMPSWSLILVIAGIFLCALLGGVIGRALLKKHFVKAGIA